MARPIVALNTGPVLPHYLAREDDPPTSEYGNLAARTGQVLELIWPDDPRSLSKRVLEYRVAVQHLDEWSRTATTREYPNCVALNGLAGLADLAIHTLRADGAGARQGIGEGSKVVLLCVNGETASGVIIGGLRDDQDLTDTQLRQSFGDHFLLWRFNGIRFSVRADGSAAVVRSGPTEADGKTKDGTPSDSTCGITMRADGSVIIGANNSTNSTTAEQAVRVNQPARRVELVAGDGIHVGKATDATLLGETYRNAQVRYHGTVGAILKATQACLDAVQQSLETTATLLVIPIVGPILAAASVKAVAVQVKVLSELVRQAAAALDLFEGGGNYLSEKNRSD